MPYVQALIFAPAAISPLLVELPSIRTIIASRMKCFSAHVAGAYQNRTRWTRCWIIYPDRGPTTYAGSCLLECGCASIEPTTQGMDNLPGPRQRRVLLYNIRLNIGPPYLQSFPASPPTNTHSSCSISAPKSSAYRACREAILRLCSRVKRHQHPWAVIVRKSKSLGDVLAVEFAVVSGCR